MSFRKASARFSQQLSIDKAMAKASPGAHHKFEVPSLTWSETWEGVVAEG